jgi:hypothetical protein
LETETGLGVVNCVTNRRVELQDGKVGALQADCPVRTIEVVVPVEFTASCLRGSLLPVDLRAICSVRAAKVVDVAELTASCS